MERKTFVLEPTAEQEKFENLAVSLKDCFSFYEKGNIGDNILV